MPTTDPADRAEALLALADIGACVIEGDDSLKPWARQRAYRVVDIRARAARRRQRSSARPQYVATVYSEHDARLIAEAPTLLRQLVDEVRRLRARLRPGSGDGATHYPGCWRDHGHHACAVGLVEELEAERDEAQADERRAFKAGYRWGYRQRARLYGPDPDNAYDAWVDEDDRDDRGVFGAGVLDTCADPQAVLREAHRARKEAPDGD